jgi:hypothetical protein
MSKEPELGQIAFGNPTGAYGTDEAVDAFVDSLLTEIERVFWNRHQKEWDRLEDPRIPGLVFRPYYWGNDKKEAAKPNLKFDFSSQEIRWYKRPGRGQSCSVEWSMDKWREWFLRGISVIRKADMTPEKLARKYSKAKP